MASPHVESTVVHAYVIVVIDQGALVRGVVATTTPAATGGLADVGTVGRVMDGFCATMGSAMPVVKLNRY